MTGLTDQIRALLDLDASGALVPHGIGGHARTLLQGSLDALDARDAEIARKDAALTVIANASQRSETMFGGKMSEVTRVFENITRVARAALRKDHPNA